MPNGNLDSQKLIANAPSRLRQEWALPQYTIGSARTYFPSLPTDLTDSKLFDLSFQTNVPSNPQVQKQQHLEMTDLAKKDLGFTVTRQKEEMAHGSVYKLPEENFQLDEDIVEVSDASHERDLIADSSHTENKQAKSRYNQLLPQVKQFETVSETFTRKNFSVLASSVPEALTSTQVPRQMIKMKTILKSTPLSHREEPMQSARRSPYKNQKKGPHLPNAVQKQIHTREMSLASYFESLGNQTEHMRPELRQGQRRKFNSPQMKNNAASGRQFLFWFDIRKPPPPPPPPPSFS